MTGQVTAAARAAAPAPDQGAQVRAFNRFYTNVIGVLHDMYLGTPYTLTESRLLFEIARHGTAEASWLRQALDIDAGYLSRVLSRFGADGLVTRHRSAAWTAGRCSTPCGWSRRPPGGRNLRPGPAGAGPGREVTLRPLRAGDLGWILPRHATGYAAEFGWDARFEVFGPRLVGQCLDFARQAGHTDSVLLTYDQLAAFTRPPGSPWTANTPRRPSGAS